MWLSYVMDDASTNTGLEWDQPWFSKGIEKCTFFNLLNEYIGPSTCVHYWVWSSWYNLRL